MSRKQSDTHYIYKTTCMITGRYYIGMHSTTNSNDGYLGSGKVLRRSIRKYGKENHTKEILEFFETKEKLINAEKSAITPQMISDRNCMNLVSGGIGWNSGHTQAFQFKLNNDPEFRKDFSRKVSLGQKNLYLTNKRKVNLPDWKGKTHSEETKALMINTRKGTGIGVANSQYDTYWVTDGVNNKKIKKDEDLPLGWIKGRSIIHNLSNPDSSQIYPWLGTSNPR